MDLMKQRKTVLIASCIVKMFIGIAYCWSIFQSSFMAESQNLFVEAVVASSLALAFTFHTGIGPITMITGGAMKKKFGVGGVVKIGAVLTLLGFLCVGFARNLGMIWLGFGIIAGFGIGMINGITTTNPGLWYPEKRGMIAGLTTAFFGLGSIIFPFILRPMIASIGISRTFIVLAVLIGAVAFVCGHFISAPPEGWLPEGFTPKKADRSIRNYTWKEMILDKRYYPAVIAFLCFASTGLFVIQSATGMSRMIGGLGENSPLVAYTVSFIGIANSGGRLLWGSVSDKIGRYRALEIMGVIVAISGFLLSMVNGSYVSFILLAMLIAACYGGSMGVYPALTAENFGPKNNAINYGVMFIGFALGGFIGPKIFTGLMESSGSFRLPLSIVGIFGIAATILVILLVKFRKAMSTSE